MFTLNYLLLLLTDPLTLEKMPANMVINHLNLLTLVYANCDVGIPAVTEHFEFPLCVFHAVLTRNSALFHCPAAIGRLIQALGSDPALWYQA